MRLRGIVKHVIFGVRPFYRGAFPYFGQDVYFPAGSHLFTRACAEGLYEQQTLSLITTLVRENTTFIDVGANIGLLSIPVLVQTAAVSVVSVEPSPETLRYLERTWSRSEYRTRWKIIGSAVGYPAGETEFWTSTPANGAFDGIRDTGRGGPKRPVVVNVRTLDQIWRDLGCPPISVIKIDVEGAEHNVLTGGREMIAQERPALVIEWSRLNLPAYGMQPRALLDICRDIDYRLYACPSLCSIESETLLLAAMAQTETFLLISKGIPGPAHALSDTR